MKNLFLTISQRFWQMIRKKSFFYEKKVLFFSIVRGENCLLRFGGERNEIKMNKKNVLKLVFDIKYQQFLKMDSVYLFLRSFFVCRFLVLFGDIKFLIYCDESHKDSLNSLSTDNNCHFSHSSLSHDDGNSG